MKQIMTIYLSGPMKGLPNFNYPAFNAAALRLREWGYTVLNPAENFGGDMYHPGGRPAYMRLDFKHVMESDAVAVLPGWRKSRGAQAEVLIATELELPIIDAATLKPISETICEEADRLVSSDRNDDYGHPFFDFSRTGRMWGAVLSEWAKKTNGDQPVPPELVPLCMVCVKISRQVNHPKRDNLSDGAGYFKTCDMVLQHIKDSSK